MSVEDRERWDARYANPEWGGPRPPSWMDAWDADIPTKGQVLDVAGGSGRIAVPLAARGLDVIVIDVSPVGLEQAREAARKAGVAVDTCLHDLETEPLPDGPFALISCARYLQRELFPQMRARLAPGGVLLLEMLTKKTREKLARPSLKRLVDLGETREFCEGLEIVHYEECWAGDVHAARALARKVSS